MEERSELLGKAIGKALSGEGAHTQTADMFEGLDWELAGTRPANKLHSIFELLMHISYWQGWGVDWLDGKKPTIPRHAAGSWPKKHGPSDEEEWRRAVQNFRQGLEDLEQRAGRSDPFEKIGAKTRLEMLHALASHASYHAGQVVAVRKLLHVWPPPKGGLTW